MSVKQLLTTTDSDELSEWIAYDRFNTIRPERQDFLAAMICTIIANSNSKKNYKVKDFMPKFRKTIKKPMSWKEMQKLLMGASKKETK